MVVDFEVRKAPSFTVASITRNGPWKEDNLRSEFRELTRWAAKRGVPTGRWIFYHKGDHRWEACLEIRGKAKATGRIRLKTLPATYVARCIFNPEAIADRVIYHGLSDWTRWRRRYKEIKSVGGSREVYSGDPWSDAQAWEHCEVQFLVRK
jgi:effector-binding domain-containing protein